MENLLKELCPPKQQLTERQGSFMQRDQCLVSWKPKMSIKLGACLEANTTPTKKKKKKICILALQCGISRDTVHIPIALWELEMYKITVETRILYCRYFQESVLNYLPKPQFMSLGGFANFKNQLLASSCLSICPPPWNNLAPTGQIFMKFDISTVKNL